MPISFTTSTFTAALKRNVTEADAYHRRSASPRRRKRLLLLLAIVVIAIVRFLTL